MVTLARRKWAGNMFRNQPRTGLLFFVSQFSLGFMGKEKRVQIIHSLIHVFIYFEGIEKLLHSFIQLIFTEGQSPQNHIKQWEYSDDKK